MTLWAIIPVKPLRRGKSRLAGTLSEDERTELNRTLLEHTLKTLSNIRELEEVLVISRDPQALTLARNHGERATVIAQVYATRGVLVLPADLPLVTREDVLTLIEHANDPPVVVIAPDRHGKGTNALLMSPSGLIEYDFGEDSFQRHCERVKASGARLEIVDLPSLGLDLDVPEDLEVIRNLEKNLSL
jgi:2-phospho-L-lactate guanylyltransferase